MTFNKNFHSIILKAYANNPQSSLYRIVNLNNMKLQKKHLEERKHLRKLLVEWLLKWFDEAKRNYYNGKCVQWKKCEEFNNHMEIPKSIVAWKTLKFLRNINRFRKLTIETIWVNIWKHCYENLLSENQGKHKNLSE